DVLELDKRNITGLEEFRERLSRYSIRYLISVHQSVRTALALKNIKAEHKISYSLWWNRLFFAMRVKRPMNLPEPLRVLALLSPIDADVAVQIDRCKNKGQHKNVTNRSTIMSWPETIPPDYQ